MIVARPAWVTLAPTRPDCQGEGGNVGAALRPARQGVSAARLFNAFTDISDMLLAACCAGWNQMGIPIGTGTHPKSGPDTRIPRARPTICPLGELVGRAVHPMPSQLLNLPNLFDRSPLPLQRPALAGARSQRISLRVQK